MIQVNVYFAETNRAYDFRADSAAPTGQLAADMVSLIALQDRLTLERAPGVFLLCKRGTREIFDPAASLASYDIRSGDELMLI